MYELMIKMSILFSFKTIQSSSQFMVSLFFSLVRHPYYFSYCLCKP